MTSHTASLAGSSSPSVASSNVYQTPSKRILTPAHLKAFQRSKTHDEILDFVRDLNDSVKGKTLQQAGNASHRTQPIMSILDDVLAIAHDTPPVDNKLSRFGNPAFKSLYDKIGEASTRLHKTIPGLAPDAIPEVEAYFKDAWGNRERVDYGSGMELNFTSWLYCLVKLGILTKDDFSFIVLGIFWRYIMVMRYLQSTYWLEPAGSHGMWGLDDYQFLPFLWGSGQLRGHRHLSPKAIHDPEVLDAFGKDYMYLSCVQFINSIKTVSLRWHSPMLDDISAVKTWEKINSGMCKMYDAEVLGKLPVMQHALFGTLIPFPTPEEDPELARALEDESEDVDECGHGHSHKAVGGWAMDCCGIPVPSAFAEAQQARAGGAQASAPKAPIPFIPRSGIKPIPFD